MDLPLFSAAFAALAITLYVMLDGFDLGVGALLLTERDETLRDQMIDSIMPMWDGNETWLVMTGVTLLAAFPVAYGILMPAFYFPLIVMLLSLGLRGVSFDFRFQVVGQSRRFWDVAVSLGSISAASMRIAGTALVIFPDVVPFRLTRWEEFRAHPYLLRRERFQVPSASAVAVRRHWKAPQGFVAETELMFFCSLMHTHAGVVTFLSIWIWMPQIHSWDMC